MSATPGEQPAAEAAGAGWRAPAAGAPWRLLRANRATDHFVEALIMQDSPPGCLGGPGCGARAAGFGRRAGEGRPDGVRAPVSAGLLPTGRRKPTKPTKLMLRRPKRCVDVGGPTLGNPRQPTGQSLPASPPRKNAGFRVVRAKASKAVRLFRGQVGVVCMGHCRRKKIAAGSRGSREGAEGGRGMGMACLPLGLGTYVGMKKRAHQNRGKQDMGVAGGCIHTAE